MNLLSNKTIGFSFAIFGTLLFSLKSIFIKLCYLQGMNAHEVLVLRMLLSLPFYLLILLFLIKKSTLKSGLLQAPRVIKIFLLGFLGYYLASLLDLMGLEYISAQLERLSLFTYPFMVAVIGFIFFSEKITQRLILSMLIAYAGLWLVMGQEDKLTGNNVFLGTALVLGAALSFALYVLFSKKMLAQVGSIFFTCIAMIASSVFVFIHAAYFVDYSSLHISNIAWFWLLLLAVFSTVIPSFMMTEAIHRIGPTHTGVVGTLGPIFTIVLAIYWLNEPFTLAIFFGFLMVVIGVLLIMIKK